MNYVGSKNRHAKDIISVMQKDIDICHKYVEPFVGGGNLFDKVNHDNKYGYDINKYVIALLKSVRDYGDWFRDVTEEDYKHVRENKDSYSDAIVGFVGFCCSYSGKFFGGFARGNDSKGIPRNYALESKRNLEKQISGLSKGELQVASYDTLSFGKGVVIYCDPPYKGTTKYKDGINYDEFYNWCRKQRERGAVVYVSEYNMPDDFDCVWGKGVNSSLTKNTGSKKNTERLFKL